LYFLNRESHAACTLKHITVSPVLRGHLWDKEKVAYKTGDLLMTGQDRGDLSIQATV
jgi:hypothetical protein